MLKLLTHQIDSSTASDNQGLVKDPGTGLFLPHDVVLGLTSIDTSVTITDNGDGTYDLSATGGGGGGGGGGVILIESGDDPATYSPSVKDIIFEKAPDATTWDFQGLSSLPAGWATRGTVSTTFASDGMQGVYDAGESHYFTLPGTAVAGTFEAKLVTSTSGGVMSGPQVYNTASGGGKGACTAWYNSPSGCLILTTGSGHTYNGGFTNAGGTPGYPVWFRVRTDANGLVFSSYSTDGVAWSTEAVSVYDTDGANEVSLGSIFGTATTKWEYATWRPSTSRSGILGWWNGSDVVPF